MQVALRLAAALGSGFVIGSTSWFFFIQSPALLRFMGREKFVPVQMFLTRRLFDALLIAGVVAAGATFAEAGTALDAPQKAALAALLSTAINRFVIVPRALEAGRASTAERRGKDSEVTMGKAIADGGGSGTRFWHRTVVVFVVAMVLGSTAHLATLVSP